MEDEASGDAPSADGPAGLFGKSGPLSGWRKQGALRRFLALAIVGSVLTLAALFFYSFSTQREAFLESLTRLDPFVFLIAVALHIGALLIWAIRLVLLTDGAGHPIPLTAAIEAVFAGVFVAALTPARLGGEPMRFAVLNARNVPPREASLIVLLERGLDVVLFIILGIVASIVLIPRLPQSAILAIVVPLGILFLITLVVIPLIVVFRPRWVHPFLTAVGKVIKKERVERAKEWLVLEMARVRRALATVLSRKPSRVPLAILATVLSWGMEFGVLAYLLFAFGHDIPFLLVSLGAVLVVLLTTLPLLPGGSGVAEVGAMGIFSAMTTGLTATFVLVWRVTTYYMDVLVGGVFAFRFAGAETRKVLLEAEVSDD